MFYNFPTVVDKPGGNVVFRPPHPWQVMPWFLNLDFILCHTGRPPTDVQPVPIRRFDGDATQEVSLSSEEMAKMENTGFQ